MKKYFLKDSEKELEFGDSITADFTTEMKNGHTKHHHLDCVFIPELIPMLLETGMIREEEADDEEGDADIQEIIDRILDAQEDILQRIEHLEEEVASLQKALIQMIEKSKPKAKK
jgi:hypothetical protein